jgi:hypothetical protein
MPFWFDFLSAGAVVLLSQDGKSTASATPLQIVNVEICRVSNEIKSALFLDCATLRRDVPHAVEHVHGMMIAFC